MSDTTQTTKTRSYYFWLGYEASADQEQCEAAWFDAIWNLDGSGAAKKWREIFPTGNPLDNP